MYELSPLHLIKILTILPPVINQPSTKTTKDFLNTGVLPRAQSNSQVTVYTPGMTRRPISNPYEVPTGVLAGDIDSGKSIAKLRKSIEALN
jgi:hypothetical protein